ncbi:MAG: hypothetical protein E6K96_08940 [Thaumarchaeota archaeon]|nr:MAG: hypothetical protein E6K96_08940 [Nitrososphaerota archaeon]
MDDALKMARAKSVQTFRDEPLDLEAKIIRAIQKVGPKNVSLLSRLTGAHAETIRYKVKKQFGRLGFKIHADVDYRKLGLFLHWGTLQFTQRYAESARGIFTSLNEAGYLTYYGKVVPQGRYVALFALPTNVTEEYRGFLNELKKVGVLIDFSFEEVLVSRHNLMNPRYFNFQSGKWEVDWSKVKLEDARPLEREERRAPAEVDLFDLLLIKELQIDALQHIVGIARKLKVHQKTLEYHYRTHVQKQKLIPTYYVRWMRNIEKTLAHSVMVTRLTFKGLTTNEFLKAQSAISKIPFLWAEDLLKDGTYLATLCIPVQETLTTFDYLSTQVPGLDERVQVGLVDQGDASLFTIPYNMFEKGWKFDAERLKSSLLRTIKISK